eukprot:scaffold2727_cov385-Prasinococcus_capsulatus_cf.AAC.9
MIVPADDIDPAVARIHTTLALSISVLPDGVGDAAFQIPIAAGTGVAAESLVAFAAVEFVVEPLGYGGGRDSAGAHTVHAAATLVLTREQHLRLHRRLAAVHKPQPPPLTYESTHRVQSCFQA